MSAPTSAPVRTCEIDGCERPHKARGFCAGHYNAWHYQRNAESARSRQRAWYRTNPERAAQHRRKRDPEKLREYARAAYRRNRLRRIAAAANDKAKKLGVPGTLTAEGLRARLEYFSNRCWVCGGDADSIDHVKPFAAGGANYHANIRPACMGCNNRRGHRWEGVPR